MPQTIKWYLTESYNRSEMEEIMVERGLTEIQAAELIKERLTGEIELLIDVDNKKIIGCNGFYLSNKAYPK